MLFQQLFKKRIKTWISDGLFVLAALHLSYIKFDLVNIFLSPAAKNWDIILIKIAESESRERPGEAASFSDHSLKW